MSEIFSDRDDKIAEILTEPGEFRKNFLKLEIFYNEISYEIGEEYEAYTVSIHSKITVITVTNKYIKASVAYIQYSGHSPGRGMYSTKCLENQSQRKYSPGGRSQIPNPFQGISKAINAYL